MSSRLAMNIICLCVFLISFWCVALKMTTLISRAFPNVGFVYNIQFLIITLFIYMHTQSTLTFKKSSFYKIKDFIYNKNYAILSLLYGEHQYTSIWKQICAFKISIGLTIEYQVWQNTLEFHVWIVYI